MTILSKYKKGFKRLFIVVSFGYFATFLTLYFDDYREPDCSDVISKQEYEQKKKMLSYKPTTKELKQHEEYRRKVDQLYEDYKNEHGKATTIFEEFDMRNNVKLPNNPLAGKAYFIEKDPVIDRMLRKPLKKYEKCNEAWYWKYLKPITIALIIYTVTLMALWLAYSILNWVIKGFKEGT